MPAGRWQDEQGPTLPKSEHLLFGRAAILRSLIVFNAIFAVQTALDLTYLWGGTALPDGMSYAHYAHRGAYPLIVTALLAAAFVLAAMRKDGPAEGSVWIKRLVYLWTGQNVLLVVSSILRLWLYVEVYSLTELRIAAGIWMALVAVGLVLILPEDRAGQIQSLADRDEPLCAGGRDLPFCLPRLLCRHRAVQRRP